jgi:hypothetical protein
MMKLRIPTAIGVLAFLASTLTAAAASNITLYAGSQIQGRMRNSIDTANAYVGQRFSVDVIPPYPSGNSAFAGAVMVGHVTRVVHAGQGRKPQLSTQFDYIRFSDGTVADVSGSVTAGKHSNTLRNAGHAALTTLGGMFAGNIIGKTIFRVGGGGLIGGVTGLVVGLNKKSDYTIAAGTSVSVGITKTVVIRRQARR